MKRLYASIVANHLKKYRQMAFLAGPRQVGKTTTGRWLKELYPNYHYLNWENSHHRSLILKGSEAVADYTGLHTATEHRPLIVFDEIHKLRKWKLFLKGFFDLYEKSCRIVVTGSAKLNVYRRGGDSLMGRYFPYHVHPLSTGELLNPIEREQEILLPREIDEALWERLFQYGGFPEPFINSDRRFSNRWQRLRTQQLLNEDIRELSQIQDFAELEALMQLLNEEAGQQIHLSTLANQLNVAATTVQRWLKTLESFYYCFSIKPWSKNVRRSLRKTPKAYLWDWSTVHDQGARVENFIASHLLKSVHYWTDLGFGDYQLYYLRDREKREVDFLVTRDTKPWLLVEAKATKNKGISKNLHHFSKMLEVSHSFQVVYDLPYADVDCFSYEGPIIVPAKTFLSQLV